MRDSDKIKDDAIAHLSAYKQISIQLGPD